MDRKKKKKRSKEVAVSKEAVVDRPSTIHESQKKRKEKVERGHGRSAKYDQQIAKKENRQSEIDQLQNR